jgi:hypothetical protein
MVRLTSSLLLLPLAVVLLLLLTAAPTTSAARDIAKDNTFDQEAFFAAGAPEDEKVESEPATKPASKASSNTASKAASKAASPSAPSVVSDKQLLGAMLVSSAAPKCFILNFPERTKLHLATVVTGAAAGGDDVGRVTVRLQGKPPSKKSKRKTLFGGVKALAENVGINGLKEETDLYEGALKADRDEHAFTTKFSGAHNACVLVVSASPSNPVLLEVSLTVGNDDTFYLDDAIKNHLSKIESTLKQLTDLASTLVSESDYAKELELTFHDQSLSMNSSSYWWPLAKVAIMVVAGIAQAVGMRGYLKKKKLV